MPESPLPNPPPCEKHAQEREFGPHPNPPPCEEHAQGRGQESRGQALKALSEAEKCPQALGFLR